MNVLLAPGPIAEVACLNPVSWAGPSELLSADMRMRRLCRGQKCDVTMDGTDR